MRENGHKAKSSARAEKKADLLGTVRRGEADIASLGTVRKGSGEKSSLGTVPHSKLGEASGGSSRTTHSRLLRGLSEAQARESRARYGANVLTKRRGKSFFRMFSENLGDPVIKVLLIALAVNIAFTFKDIDWYETGGIALAVLIAATVSTLSEYSSRSAFEKLNARAESVCTVRREGETVSIPSSSVVVGDIILLSSGDRICADGVLLSGSVFLDQSMMTGESREVQKGVLDHTVGSSEEVGGEELAPSSASSCLSGCLVSSGEGEMLVCRVGDATELGAIVRELQGEVRESPLKLRLSRLARQISVIGYALALLVALTSVFYSVCISSDFVREVMLSKLTDMRFMLGTLLDALTLGLTVVIMAVPEGLPMMIAVVLSSNVVRMARDNVLVRKSTGIESAGSMNLLFTDKTGTLTRGMMSVESYILPDGTIVRTLEELKLRSQASFDAFCENCAYNTSSRIAKRRAAGGNATERALLEAVKRHVTPDPSKIREKEPFDSKNKFSTATLGSKIYIKGAPEVIIPHLEGSLEGSFDRFLLESRVSELSLSGKRVLLLAVGEKGVAERKGAPLGTVRQGDEKKTFLGTARSLKLICAAVICDEVRREARGSVSALREAGIDVVMITGDSENTARSIAEAVGILNDRRDLCLSHGELERMDDGELTRALPRLAVVSRAMPGDKSRLVRIAQAQELVVGMTGDGINDAPALKLADVGFAMGNGADVAKDAGDIVILDNDLSSVVRAVLYGRNIFKSIRKFLVFQLTMNFSSALVCMLGPFWGFRTPITVTQMLWVNMIMDTLGGLAFAGEFPSRRCLRERPKRRDEPILNGYMVHQILITGTFGVVISMLFLISPHFTEHFRGGGNSAVHLSAFFALFIFLGVMQCINSRTDRLNLFVGIGKNPTFVLIMLLICALQLTFVYFGGAVLRAAPLALCELLFTVSVAALAVPFEFCRKLLWRFSGHTEGF